MLFVKNKFSRLFKNSIFNNSLWGIFAQFSQSVFLSLFFVIVARQYSTTDFANYILVTVLFQLVIAFSTLGLSQWFVREIISETDQTVILNKFFKIQFLLGVAFYFINIGLAYALYDDDYIRFLSIIYGVNVVFDNLINAIKCVNIANGEQKKTFIILTLEAFLKLIIGCLLFVYPFSITWLTVALIVVRLITLNLFLTFGSSNFINIFSILKYKIDLKDLKKLILANWAFIIIGGVSMINWRVSTIIISKLLTVVDVANYEISYKLFSIAQILPIIISTSVFPKLIKLFGNKNQLEFNHFYRNMHLLYLGFGLLSYTFIFSFGDLILPIAFGEKYIAASGYTKEMFLTMLVFPTALLQANVLVAMNREKLDMYFNVIILIVNVSLCFIGLNFIKSLSVVNYSIFIAFIIFHLCQDVVLIRSKIASVKDTIEFYIIGATAVALFVYGSQIASPISVFIIFWLVAAVGFFLKFKISNNKIIAAYND